MKSWGWNPLLNLLNLLFVIFIYIEDKQTVSSYAAFIGHNLMLLSIYAKRLTANVWQNLKQPEVITYFHKKVHVNLIYDSS